MSEPFPSDRITGPDYISVADARKAIIKAREEGRREGLASLWQPIETAPRDGTRFLAYQGDRNERHFECWWDIDYYSRGSGWRSWWDEPNPTYWMPIPAIRALKEKQP